MDIKDVPALAIAASQIGPDFYAVLLITVVTMGAGYLLLRAQKSQPQLSKEQLRPFSWVFIISCVCGMTAIVMSIGWYIYKQTHGIYTAQIAITNMTCNIAIDSRYFSKKTLHQNIGDGTLDTDEYFLIVSDRPFSNNDNFVFDVYIKGSDTSVCSNQPSAGGIGIIHKKSLKVPFSGKGLQSFRLVIDASLQPKLEVTSATSRKQWFSWPEIYVAKLSMGDGDEM